MTQLPNKKVMSIRYKLMIVFVAVTVVMTTLISALILLSWRGSAIANVEDKAAELNRSITVQIENFLQVPYHINDANSRLIENGTVDMSDPDERDRFFVSILESHKDDIYSVGFGGTEGTYYGARRNEDDAVQIMRNGPETGGQSWYYHVTADQTAGDLAVRAGAFDPRTRVWYQAAEREKGAIYSPIYKHFIMPDLTISAGWPIYTKSGALAGVLATHVILADINSKLEGFVSDLNGYAAVIETETGDLVANSSGQPNFQIQEKDQFQRLSLQNADLEVLTAAYKEYLNKGRSSFALHDQAGTYYLQFTDYSDGGLQWTVITAVPQGPLLVGITESIRNVIAIIILLVLAYIFVYLRISKKLIAPVDELTRSAARIAEGDLHHRARIQRDDEIGKIAASFNSMADTLEKMVETLEEKVRERSWELAENREQLQLILDSTAEGIYGMDHDGLCTFCNAKALEMLGYDSSADVLGKNMHWLIHHSNRSGAPLPESECKIFIALRSGRTVRSSDEVFWRKDGTFFDVEYHTSPQYKEDGNYIGAVVTFMDITERKERESQIEYLSCHDSLTGLKNRRCAEDNIRDLDVPENLPLSVIFADVNGLKITNDIFGHAAGDELIRTGAEVLSAVARERDIVARIGGDEYILVMPNTGRAEADKVKRKIIQRISRRKIRAIKCSIAVGYETKTDPALAMEELINRAENEMYKHKVQSKRESGIDSVETILASLHEASPRERIHSENVKALSLSIGQKMNMDASSLKRLGEAAYLHDIGKIAFTEDLLKGTNLSSQEKIRIQEHSVVGYRVLNLFDDTLDLAAMVYSHHENWDGTGYPKGLKGEEIPLEARIIRVAETFDAKTNPSSGGSVEREKAAEIIQELSGSRFDPAVVAAFISVIEKKEQGSLE